MKKIIYALICLFFSSCLLAQNSISGKLIDAETKTPLEYSNITLKKLQDSTIVDGTISDEKGFFKLSNIKEGNYFIEIISLGYELTTINDIVINSENTAVNLNSIKVAQNVNVLQEVSIVEQVNDVEYKLDRKIIRVNQDILSAGASAVEVLENQPSISTDIDGNVSLRGSESFLVLIDGRPSALTGSDALQQIDASSIDNIEIITNPSAKYAADGVAGIINVIMKKDKRKGLNGQFSANYGSFNSFGVDGLINMRLEKFNFFVGAQFNKRNRRGTGTNIRKTFLDNDTLFLNTNGDNKRENYSANFRAGFDYYITDNDVITISGKYNRYSRANASEQFTEYYNSVFGDSLFNDIFYSTETAFDLKGGYYSGEINYYKKFKKPGHELQAFFNFSSDFDTEYNNYYQYMTDSEFNKLNSDKTANQTTTDYTGRIYTAKIDYVLPLFKEAKFETGWEMRYSIHDNDYNYQTLIGDSWTNDTTKNNPYRFTNDIQSLYALFSDIRGKFGYQLGVRGELTDRSFFQKESGKKWPYTDIDIFPSVHLSYQLPKDMQIMTSYSRRLRRPRSHFLDPFIEIRDPNNFNQGNPFLEPEYTNSFEINFQKKINTNFISVELFARNTKNKSDRITSIYTDENNITYDSIYISKWENIGEDFSFGTEIMANFNIFKWWNITATGDVFYYKILSEEYNDQASVNWNIRVNNTFRISKIGTMIQFGANYRAPSITAQGKRYGGFMSNLGIRQDFLDKTLSVSVSLRDVFKTGVWKNETYSDRLYSMSENKRFSPTFNISITYKLNDFNITKEKKIGNEENVDEEF